MLYVDEFGISRRYDGVNAYKVKGRSEWLLATDGDSFYSGQGALSCSVYTSLTEWNSKEVVPPMCHCNATLEYLEEECYQVSMAALPEAWREEFTTYLQIAAQR